MKKKTLYLKFILVYVIYAILCFTVVAVFSSWLSIQRSVESKASELYDQAVQIADAYSDIYTDGSVPSDFGDQLRAICAYSNLRIWLQTGDGMIYFDTAASGNLTGTTVADFDAADSRKNYRTGDYYGTFSTDMLSVLAPVTANFKTYGYVVIHMPLSEAQALGDQMLIPLYITALIVFLLSLMILLVIRTDVLKPMRKISEAASEYASGNLKHTIKIDSDNELGRLADTLNLMAQELSSSEDYQKKFIANVSHDFRSPLTSIRGYLTAIADGVIAPEDQEKYIRIVIKETERLNNLTQSMLSLNSLDRKNMHLEYSDFDICPLIKNVCATFERSCEMRDISFDLILSSASVPVHADMGKIQQVIYNLVDNAIKFSHDHSAITIRVSEKAEKVFISVKDDGIGISRADQKQIWTRFFKTDTSRGKDKKGTGLGLSIVKEIITAHDETIDVISTEGAGTEFVFRLQRGGTEEVRDIF